MSSAPRDGFEAVDRMPAPNRFVAMMDAVHADAQAVAQKRRWMELLEVRPGERLLDLGCGAGADALALAERAGPSGTVVGIDASLTMLTAAHTRAAPTRAPLRFVAADANNLPLRAGSVDRCWSDRVFQHLSNPPRALAELVRVTRPGGRIVIGGPDFGTQVLDLDDRATTRALLDFRCDHLRRHGWIGRQLPRLFADAGLVNVTVHPTTVTVIGTPPASLLTELRTLAERAQAAGAVAAAIGAAWIAGVNARAAAGRWFSAHTSFTVTGDVPAA